MNNSINLSEITLGVCYYPEHWDAAIWSDDLERMKSCGISIIRIAEFAWNIFEPRDNEFSFDFFDSFIEIAHSKNMKIILGTPTATPPIWLSEKYPEILNAYIDGNLIYPGLRRHYNMNSPVYQKYCLRITSKLAEHYVNHPAIIGWQLDNEFNCEIDTFHSQTDHIAFREYLKDKYKTIDNLNRAMGTIVWNQTYNDWDEIYLKRRTAFPGQTNPHLDLEEDRFIAQSVYNFALLQANEIRKWQQTYNVTNQFITHNGAFPRVNYHKLTNDILDFICYDNYPAFSFSTDVNPAQGNGFKDRNSSFNLTRIRSISPNFGIMEQQSGAGGWTGRMKMAMPKPGQMRLWSFQAIAHGADFISFFRWRTARVGNEIYWHGLLDYDNRDNRRIEELKQFNADRMKLAEIAGSKVKKRVALLMDYDNEWDGYHDIWHGPLANISNNGWFVALEKNHIPFDFKYLDEDTDINELQDYELLVYPHATIFSQKRFDLLQKYINNGGKVIFGCRSGYKDLEGHCLDIPMPGLISALTGCYVKEYTALSPYDNEIFIECNTNKALASDFIDVLEITDGEAIGFFKEYDDIKDHFVDEPAIVSKTIGNGLGLYVGSVFNEAMVTMLLDYLNIKEDLSLICAPASVEIVIRENSSAKYYFILNYDKKPVTIRINKAVINILSSETISGDIPLNGYDLLILKEDK